MSKHTYESRMPLWLFYGLIFLTIVKLILSSREEMLGFYLPNDDLWQVWAAERWYWGGDYGTDHLYHLPVYPLFIKVISLTGVPLRVGMELLYCFSCSLLAITLRRMGIPSVVVGIMAFVAIMTPSSFPLLNRFGPEVLLTSWLLLAFSQSIQWWILRKTSQSLPPALLSCLFWALAWNTRKEAIVLLPIFIMLAICVILIDKADRKWLQIQRILVGVILPLGACFVLSLTIHTINYLRWGLFADSILTAPGYTFAFKALQSIRPTKNIDYIPITVEARKAAYKVSPSFALLEGQLEGPIGKGWACCSKEWMDSKGLKDLDPLEISAGWFYWALYDSAVKVGYATTPESANALFYKIGKEITTALTKEKLPKRFVPIAMIDPDFLHWLPRYGTSLIAVYNTFLTPSMSARETGDQPMLGDHVKKEFDLIANRRSIECADASNGCIEGWVLSPGHQIQAIQLLGSSGEVIKSLNPTQKRNDVSPEAHGFSLHVPLSSQDIWLEDQIIILVDNGECMTWHIKELAAGKINHRPLTKNSIDIACDRLEKPQLLLHWSWYLQKVWEAIYYPMIRYGQWIGLMGLCLVVFLKRTSSSILVVTFLFSTAIIVRVLFFAILDASSWNGAQPRYLFPVMPEFSMLIVLGTYSFFNECIKKSKEILSQIKNLL